MADQRVLQVKYIFGIDGGKKTGLALWLPKEIRFEFIETTDFWGAYLRVCEFPVDDTAVFIEDPGKNKPTFNRDRLKRKVLDQTAQRIGSVKRESRLLGEGLSRWGFVVKFLRPARGGTFKGSGKWSAADLRQITGWKKRTSEHARDAARLVYNRGSRIVVRA